MYKLLWVNHRALQGNLNTYVLSQQSISQVNRTFLKLTEHFSSQQNFSQVNKTFFKSTELSKLIRRSRIVSHRWCLGSFRVIRPLPWKLFVFIWWYPQGFNCEWWTAWYMVYRYTCIYSSWTSSMNSSLLNWQTTSNLAYLVH